MTHCHYGTFVGVLSVRVRARTCVISYCRSCFLLNYVSYMRLFRHLERRLAVCIFLLLLLYINVHYIIYSSYFHPFDFMLYYYYYNTT